MCGVQALSGTGSLRLGFEFLKKHYPFKTVYLSSPTWGKLGYLYRQALHYFYTNSVVMERVSVHNCAMGLYKVLSFLFIG